MKDKFSIFSPPASKTQSFEASINFKKSPIKFAVYQPLTKPKDPLKPFPHQSLSSTNLDNLRKISGQYSTLRQTLSFKPNHFDSFMNDDEKETNIKSNNLLRQTISNKSSYRPKTEKSFSESFGVQSSHSSFESSQRADPQQLYYSRKISYMPQTKSQHTIEHPNAEHSIEQLRQKWKDGGFKSFGSESKNQRILQQLQQLKRISSAHNREDIQPKPKTYADRKNSFKATETKQQADYNLFRKKSNPQQLPSQFLTPKIPKSSFEDRTKKIGSPTSTDNSDSRSPPNKFIEVMDIKKKINKLSMDDFSIGKTLGQGKFGQVMVARHRKTCSLFALKKIPKAMIKSHMMIDQLALQIRLQSCLNHKNILGIYGFFDDSTHLYIVLEYMENGTLYSQLKKNKILPEHQAAIIVKQVALAVQYLHDHDIAHRDIKPENIVISNGVYKLCDFGWATICNERRKTYCGTFDYAAPQILEGKQYDMSVDLWCLGVLTYELLTGKAPFYHLSRKETMRKIINCESQTITFTESMSPEAVDFIQKLIRKNPEERMKAGSALKHKFLSNIQD